MPLELLYNRKEDTYWCEYCKPIMGPFESKEAVVAHLWKMYPDLVLVDRALFG